jgi:hypothetical protein
MIQFSTGARLAALLVAAAMTPACGAPTALPLPDGSSPDASMPAQDSGPSGPSPSGANQITCVPDAGPLGQGLPGLGWPDWHPDVVTTVTGTNATLTSRCDGDGNLIEPLCEAPVRCGDGINPPCDTYQTGRVTTMAIDCAGHCRQGACDSRCPAEGHRFTVGSADGDGVRVHNDSDGRDYVCTVVFSAPGLDCTAALSPGARGTFGHMNFLATSVTLAGTGYCAGTQFGNIPVTLDAVSSPDPEYQNEACALTCGIAP